MGSPGSGVWENPGASASEGQLGAGGPVSARSGSQEGLVIVQEQRGWLSREQRQGWGPARSLWVLKPGQNAQMCCECDCQSPNLRRGRRVGICFLSDTLDPSLSTSEIPPPPALGPHHTSQEQQMSPGHREAHSTAGRTEYGTQPEYPPARERIHRM